jgi:hypothetical protein
MQGMVASEDKDRKQRVDRRGEGRVTDVCNNLYCIYV